MHEKLLTIIVPVYNTEKYLTRCFNSLIHPNIKVIIVNDGSTDNSKYFIKSYCEKYPDIFTSIETENKGATHARRLALQYIETPYFGYCDSDDFIMTASYVDLCLNMRNNNLKIGNGRMTVYLPNSNIPLNSRNWKLNKINFEYNKEALSNTTVSLLDKIFHSDLIPDFNLDSNQKVYEDMELVYYVLAKYEQMFHSNNIIYNYCMRGKENGSTSDNGLNMLRVDGLKGLLSSSQSIRTRLNSINLYKKYEEELTSIDIKLLYQRISAIITHPNIENKKEMITLILSILDQFCPNWQNNIYYLKGFKDSEWNDYIFYITSNIYLKIHNLYRTERNHDKDVDGLLEDYTKIIRISSK